MAQDKIHLTNNSYDSFILFASNKFKIRYIIFKCNFGLKLTSILIYNLSCISLLLKA